jgi:transglutaminase-like putative cysteine protease
MTLLRIEHRSLYRYHRPVGFGRHRLVLRPREGHDVHVERMSLEIRPAHVLVWTRDVFGNSVGVVDFLEEAAELEINSDVLILHTPPFPRPTGHPPLHTPYPVFYDALETTVAAAYQAVAYPDDIAAVRTWLQAEELPGSLDDAEQVMLALGHRVHERIRYQRRSERGVQTPAETLRLQSGSCRDLSTLMLDAARQLGFASRFVSGYLDCAASAAGRAAMHAWVELYFPLGGWQGFDPTVNRITGTEHVAAGVSNHPRGVMPISGMFTGASSDYHELVATVKMAVAAPADTSPQR